jgi:hypothetical protein
MNKRTFIGSLPCFGLSAFAVADNTHNRLIFELTPEMCSQASAGLLWEKRLSMNSEGASEQAQTRFYQDYESKLHEWTDLKQPVAKTVRPHVSRAFMSAMEFIILDVEGGRIHALPRFPAEIEWHIWHGFNLGFAETSARTGRYKHKTISDLLITIFEAHAEPDKNLEDSQLRIDDCLKAMTEAEKMLPEQGALYFRSVLIREIAAWL